MKTKLRMLAKYNLLFSLTLFAPYETDRCLECLGHGILPIVLYRDDQCDKGRKKTIYGKLMDNVRQPKDFNYLLPTP